MSLCSSTHTHAVLSNCCCVDILPKDGSMVVDVQHVYGHSDWLAHHFAARQSLDLGVQVS